MRKFTLRFLVGGQRKSVNFIRSLAGGPPTTTITPNPTESDISAECPFQNKLLNNHETNEVQNIVSENTSSTKKIKPFLEIPTPKKHPIFGNYLDFFRAGGGKNLHAYTRNRHVELGPLYREMNSSINVLFVGDPSGIQDIYANDSKWPAVFSGESFLYFNQIHNLKRGIFFMENEEWRTSRSRMNNLILRKRDLSELYDKTLEVFDEHFIKWKDIADKNDGHIALDVNKLIYEAGIPAMAAFLMGRSFKNYRSSIQADAVVVRDLISSLWKYNMQMQLIPPKWAHKFHLPLWKKFEVTLFSILGIGSKWVDQVVADHDNFGVGNHDGDGMIHMMFKDYNMEHKEVARIMADTVTGLDSEFVTIAWLINVLGRHPETQDKIYEELNQVCGAGNKLTHKDIEKTEFLRSVVKEVLRLYPSPVFITRFLQQDAIIGDYHVPAGTLAALNTFAAQRDPKFFPKPDEFWPERWSRTKQNIFENDKNDIWDSETGVFAKYKGVHHGAKPYMAFGWGTKRGCVFRKVSLIRIHLFIGRLIQDFKLKCDEVQPTMITIMVPDRDMNLRLETRK